MKSDYPAYSHIVIEIIMNEYEEIQIRLEASQYQYVMDISQLSGVEPERIIEVVELEK